MVRVNIGLVLVLLCIQYIGCNVSFENGISKCDTKWKKSGCHYAAIDKSTMLIDWRGSITWNDYPTYLNKLACTCASEAKKIGSSGFALFWWGQCFPLTADNMESITGSDRDSKCFQQDFKACESTDGDTLCVGNDASVYVYSMVQVDGGFSDWGQWSGCSEECGGGSRKRSRKCDDPVPALGGEPCDGAANDEEQCNIKECPVDGGYSEWTAFSLCNAECGGGTKTRTRTCTNPKPQYGGKVCINGKPEEEVVCNTQLCPVDGGFGAWTDWSSCPKTCGGASTTRSRECNNPTPQNGGKECNGNKKEAKICSPDPCHDNGGFTQWSAWSKCSATCGDATRTRTQTCEVAALCKGKTKSETGYCDSKLCPINGGYSEWTAFSSCNVKCGSGKKTRTRSCTNPKPQYGGKVCIDGKPKEEVLCNTQPCPVNGKWSQWTPWSNCTAKCSVGNRERARKCNDPSPKFKGKPCTGLSKEIEKCNEQPCILDPVIVVDPGADKRVTVCEHAKPDTIKISCPHGRYIYIKKALYGRRSLAICPKGNHKGRTNCGNPFWGARRARKHCNRKGSCTLRASNKMFNDPCRSINKYLDVTYQCRKAPRPPKLNIHNVLLCQHSKQNKKTISCPKGQIIIMRRALYGRRSKSICPQKDPRTSRNTRCGNANLSRRKLSRNCNRKNSCTLVASNTYFVNPCYGTAKYLTAQYICRIPVFTFSKWTSWTPCNPKCGFGRSIRRRNCLYKGKKTYWRRCRGRRLQSKGCYKRCALTDYTKLSKCSSSNVKKYFQKAVTPRRGLVQRDIIQKLGSEHEIKFSFTLKSLKAGLILLIREEPIGFSRRKRHVANISVIRGSTLSINLPLGRLSKTFYFRNILHAKKTYNVAISEKKQSGGGRYGVGITVTSGKLTKKQFAVHRYPQSRYQVRVFTVPGWTRPADATLNNLSINGVCTKK